ncbi:phosphotransferase [Roseovarius sp.]|uniref:phosphotransferase n=1 Tax=Roseovarius sp. TaxID=1486281 RepID=UPI003B5A6CF0
MQHVSNPPHGTLSVADLRFAPPALPPARLAEALRQAYGLEGTLKSLAGERDQNMRLLTNNGDYLAKVANPTEDPALTDFQIAALEHLAARDGTLPVPRMIPASDGALTVPVPHAGETLSLRLLSFLPGTPLNATNHVSERVGRDIGHMLGRLNRAFTGFSHPAATHFMPWDTLNGLLESRQLSQDYLPDHLRSRCAPVIRRLAATGLPAMRAMPQVMIHGDAHSGNILIAPEEPDRVCGLIDFGDMIAGPVLQELAVALASLIEHEADPVAISIACLQGFAAASPLPLDQLPYLHDAILARMILTVELLTFRVQHDLSGAASLVQTELPRSIRALERELDTDPQDFTRRVLDAANQME